MNNVAMNKYKQNSITSATPEEMTLMLYNGAIKFMNIGKYGIENKDLERAHNGLLRAQAIINELNYSLDMQYDISNELRDLYDFLLARLLDGNINKDIVAIEEAITIVSEMRDTWKEVIKEVKQQVYMAK